MGHGWNATCILPETEFKNRFQAAWGLLLLPRRHHATVAFLLPPDFLASPQSLQTETKTKRKTRVPGGRSPFCEFVPTSDVHRHRSEVGTARAEVLLWAASWHGPRCSGMNEDTCWQHRGFAVGSPAFGVHFPAPGPASPDFTSLVGLCLLDALTVFCVFWASPPQPHPSFPPPLPAPLPSPPPSPALPSPLFGTSLAQVTGR